MRDFWTRFLTGLKRVFSPQKSNNGRKPFTLVLHRRHWAVLGLLIVANIALIVVATVFAVQALTPPPPLAVPPSPTSLSISAINTEVALRFPTVAPQVTPTLGPTVAAPNSNPLTTGGTIFYAYRQDGRTSLWAQVVGRTTSVRLTGGPWDDREPTISPDGKMLAFASRREGAWNLYAVSLDTGELSRLTSGQEFKGHPAWSPDGQWIVFEIYRNNNLDIAIQNIASGQRLYLTANPAADYSPVWSPAGRSVIWVSLRSGKPELWSRSLDEPLENASVQLTRLPDILPADPVYSPDGQRVLLVDAAHPLLLVYATSATTPYQKLEEIGQGHHPQWSPSGTSIMTVAPQAAGQEYVLAAPLGQTGLAQIIFQTSTGAIHSMAWSARVLSDTLPSTLAQAAQIADAPLWNETVFEGNGDPRYSLVPLKGVNAPDARLSDRVDDSFGGLQRTVAQAVGWDFLGNLDNALVPIRAPLPPSADAETWLKVGRAFDIAQAASDAGWLEITREDRGFRTYWRVWVRARVQDGTQGEPLRQPPWNFTARYSLRPEPYDQGGEYALTMPPGYFVDFTTLANDYGWTRIPAQDNWRSFFPGLLFWRFEHRDELDWLTAIREVYTAEQAATWTPVPSPTETPTITGTPTETPLPSDTPIPTRTKTRTPRPTLSPTPTRTPRPTLSPTITPTPRPIIITVVITITPIPPVRTATPTDTSP